jgi:nitrogen fixation protein NifU and related proteins
MLDLRELYQEVILDHNKNPRNAYVMTDASCQSEGFNPLCGDRLTLYLRVKDNRIEKASFEGSGCAISTASASLMTDYLAGKTLIEAEQLFNNFHNLIMLDTSVQDEETLGKQLGKLSVLAGVREFPARVKCATLAWHTLKAAIHRECHSVSTE